MIHAASAPMKRFVTIASAITTPSITLPFHSRATSASLLRNQCPPSSGTPVHLRPESVSSFRRNMQMSLQSRLWTGETPRCALYALGRAKSGCRAKGVLDVHAIDGLSMTEVLAE